MKMIYAELQNAAGDILDKGVFLSLGELIEADQKARTEDKHWTGSPKTTIALNRHRHSRCIWCGVKVGELHDNCTPGVVSARSEAICD